MTPHPPTPAPATPYRQLDEQLIVETIARLQDRIQARFPGSGLGRVCGELLAQAQQASTCVDYLRRPNWPLRVGVGIAIAAMVAVIVVLAVTIRLPTQLRGMTEFIQVIESAINDLVFLGIAVFFLLTAEGRIKRRRALPALHQLRSVVHIVDMHQLTKDPERLLSAQPDTAASPRRTMTAPELGRYLDYCSEMLALTSKVAALYVQYLNDAVVLSAVNEIETLATGISGKIWQKITLLERGSAARLTLEPVPEKAGSGPPTADRGYRADKTQSAIGTQAT